MKRSLAAFTLVTALIAPIYAQSINNTLGSGGTFTIKDVSTTFLTLSQSDGYLNLTNSLTLPVTTESTLGVIFKGTDRFIHDYNAPGTVGFNTFVGVNSGNFALSGSGGEASFNTSIGHSSLPALTSGARNSSVGYYSLYVNTTGNDNSAFGQGALYSNTGGTRNSAIGYSAGYNITTGSNNTAIGSFASVPSATGDNQVRIGNTDVTYASIEVAWQISSDRRLKSKITQSDLGLDFISRLKPVSYFRSNDEKQRSEYGFIAQEVEGALKEAGVKNAGMLTVDDQGRYELRYNDLLAPMAKAIQELKKENDALKKEMSEMKMKVEGEIQNRIREEIRKVLLKAGALHDESTKVSFTEN